MNYKCGEVLHFEENSTISCNVALENMADPVNLQSQYRLPYYVTISVSGQSLVGQNNVSKCSPDSIMDKYIETLSWESDTL